MKSLSPDPLPASGRDGGVGIYLLGRFEVRSGGEVIIDRRWNRRKAKALVKLLGLQRGRALHREQVLETLWPDMEPLAAINNLHKNLHYLRSVCAGHGGQPSPVTMQGEMMALAPDCWVDGEAFRALAREARRLPGDAAAFERALEIYHGDLLPEDIYEDWAEAPREELRTLRLELLGEVSQIYATEGKVERAIERLQQVLQTDPLHEEAHRSLMRLYARAGSRHRALRQYQSCRDLLRRELDVEPGEETEALYRGIIEGTVRPDVPPSAPPAARTGTAASVPLRREPLPPLIGRERELERAEELLEAALNGSGGALVVSGVAGIGKSRFAEQALAAAEEAGALVLRSRSYEMEASVAYQPLREMLQQLLDGSDDGTIRAVQGSLYLKRLLPGAHVEAAPIADPGMLQVELFNEVDRLLRDLAGRQPLALLFDDLHAADEASLRLVHFLCRQLARRPVFLLATMRTEDALRGSLAQLVGSLRRERLVREIVLEPLPERAMGLVIGELFGGQSVEPALLREVANHAEGNPFFASELVHTLREAGWARLAEGRWQSRRGDPTPVPGAVHELLDLRLRRLGEAAHQVLYAASVLGRRFDYALLRRCVPWPEAAVLDGLDDCIAAFVLEEAADGYAFRHDLLREAVYRRLTRARREQLHRAVALAHAEGPPGGRQVDAEVVGFHFAASDEPWRAVPYLQAAARSAAAVFANERATSLYRQALDIAQDHPAHGEPPTLAALLDELGDVERRGGDIGQSVACYERAASLLQGLGNEGGAIRAQGKAALGRIMQGDLGGATELVGRTLQALTDQEPHEVVARTYALLAQLRWHSAQHKEALEAAEKALQAAVASGDIHQRAKAYEVLALACHSLGDWQKGVEYELSRQALGVDGFDADEAFDTHL